MNRDRLKQTAVQSIVIFALAFFAHIGKADDVMLLFLLIGITSVFHDAKLYTSLIYHVARKIVHYGNLKGWYED